MSVLSVTIPALLLVRHHKNLRRILAGTEPKVPKCAGLVGTTTTITRRYRADGFTRFC